jgi:type II secretory pathway pseudopilin PulG
MDARRHKTAGLTLIEMTLVIATITLLVGFAIPAVKALVGSFQSEGAVKSMIDAALSSARAMAMSKQRYVGVRFQKLCVSDDPAAPLKGLLDAPQYMIFIIHDPTAAPRGTNLANGFRAVEGLEPVKLPSTIGVMADPILLAGGIASMSPALVPNVNDQLTFSIIFTPSGRVVAHAVRVRNKDGEYQPFNDVGSQKTSNDDVFNSVVNICGYKQGMFIEDDYSVVGADGLNLGLGEESSVTTFWIYDTVTLRAAVNGGVGTTMRYLSELRMHKPVYVSPYTGHVVSPE